MSNPSPSAAPVPWKVVRHHAAQLAASADVSMLVEAFDAAARRVLSRVDKTTFYVVDESGEALRLLFREGVAPDEVAAHEQTAWQRHPGEVVRSKASFVVNDALIDPEGSQDAPNVRPMRSRLFVPLIVDGESVGCYGVGSIEPNQYGAADVEVMALLSDIAAVVWQRLDREAEQRRLSQQLLQSQKMELVGRLVGSIAHDFNNLLSVLMGQASWIGVNAQSAGAQARAQSMLETCERAAQLTRRLLAFSQPNDGEHGPVCVTHELRRLEPMLRQLLPESIEVRVDVPDGAVGAPLSASELEQVLLNLAVNARDAMPEGGELCFALSVQQDGDGPWCVIEVTDTGLGIPADAQTKIFEAFFTTKPKGQGTGLGLSTVQTIVSGAGGTVSFESGPQGTLFRVRFPRVDARPGAPSAPQAIATQASSKQAWVVEDEDGLRQLFQLTLEDAGCAVVTAPNGAAMLEMVTDDVAPPDVLVTDIVMPKMGGVALAETLLQRWPTLRVVLITGYEGEASIERLVAAHPAASVTLMRKPFTPHALLAAIERSPPEP